MFNFCRYLKNSGAAWCPGRPIEAFLVVEGQAFEMKRGVSSQQRLYVEKLLITDITYAAPAHYILHYLQRCIINISDELSCGVLAIIFTRKD